MQVVIADYYRLLDLQPGCAVEDVKKAYRKKAREFHPDLNPSPGAKEMFISVTEAYEFLLTYYEKMSKYEDSYQRVMDDWRRCRQSRSRQKAHVYARTSYSQFKNTSFYKTTRIFDGTTIISSLVIAIMVLFIAIFGYIYRLKHPIPGIENPTIFVLMLFIILGMILFVVSVIFLKAYIQSSRKRKNKYETAAESLR